MVFRRRTNLAVKLTILILASAGLIFILMILFNYFFLKKTYIAQARETAKLLGESKAQKVSLILARAEGVATTLAPIVAGGTRSEAELTQLLKERCTTTRKSAPWPWLLSLRPTNRAYATFHLMCIGKALSSRVIWGVARTTTSTGSGTVPQELNRALWSEPYQEPTSDTIVMTYSVPFYRDEQGQTVFKEWWPPASTWRGCRILWPRPKFSITAMPFSSPGRGCLSPCPKGVEHEPEY